jgi:hypothetical protein
MASLKKSLTEAVLVMSRVIQRLQSDVGCVAKL